MACYVCPLGSTSPPTNEVDKPFPLIASLSGPSRSPSLSCALNLLCYNQVPFTWRANWWTCRGRFIATENKGPVTLYYFHLHFICSECPCCKPILPQSGTICIYGLTDGLGAIGSLPLLTTDQKRNGKPLLTLLQLMNILRFLWIVDRWMTQLKMRGQ